MKDEGFAHTLIKRLQRRTLTLKLELLIFGFIILLLGLYPSLSQQGILPSTLQFLPLDGFGYQMMIVVVGALAFVIGFRTSRR